jgi:hypothetical protein
MASIESSSRVQPAALPVAPPADAEGADERLARWQSRLLPFMLGAVIFMTLFFLLASLWVFYDFRLRVADRDVNLAPVFAEYEAAQLARSTESLPAYLRWKTTILLEQELISRRYKQVNSVILARIWTRYLGFLTGMTLALVGAFFVLGQLRTDRSALQVQSSGLHGALETSSPGLVLAVLGAVLMAISLVVTFEFDTRDVPTYVQQQSLPDAQATTLPPPGIMRDGGKPSTRKTAADDLATVAPPLTGNQPASPPPKK